jgi:hypothetical protein
MDYRTFINTIATAANNIFWSFQDLGVTLHTKDKNGIIYLYSTHQDSNITYLVPDKLLQLQYRLCIHNNFSEVAICQALGEVITILCGDKADAIMQKLAANTEAPK